MANLQEKSLSKYLFLSYVFIVLFIVISIGAYFIYSEYNKLNSEYQKLEANTLEVYKQRSQSEVERVIETLEEERRHVEKLVKKQVKEKVEEAVFIAQNLHDTYAKTLKPELLQGLIKNVVDSIRFNKDRGYIFIMNLEGKMLSHPNRSFIGRDFSSFEDATGFQPFPSYKKIILQKQEGFEKLYFYKLDDNTNQYPKHVFLKNFGHYGWFFGSGEYLDFVEENLKKRLLQKIDFVRYMNKNFIWVFDKDAKALVHPQKDYINTFSKSNTPFGTQFQKTKKLIHEQLKGKQKGVITFSWRETSEDKLKEKIGYISLYEPYGWFIGTTLNKKDFELELQQKKDELKKSMFAQVSILLVFFVLFTIIALVLSYYVSRSINRLFDGYKRSIILKSNELEFLANHDVLTGLPNRLHLKNLLQKLIHEKAPFAILFLDLDRFKNINDTFGHHVGDDLLIEASRRLKSLLYKDLELIRLGGDEFTVIMKAYSHSDEVKTLAEKIIKVFETPFSLASHEVLITASVGISLFPYDGKSTSELLKNSDSAMYHAKEKGKNRFEFYVPEITSKNLSNLELEQDLVKAIESHEFFLVYQPQIDLKNMSYEGLEALVRWKHPQKGLIAPNVFLPVAAELGLLNKIGDWVIQTAFKQSKTWQDEGFGVKLAINLSNQDFHQPNLINNIRTAIKEIGIKPHNIEFELTEDIIMGDVKTALSKLNALKAMGFSLSIDDFGTGYSSFNYLKKFPIDKLKIDKSFIDDIVEDRNDQIIVKAIIAIAHTLDVDVIAEGVETVEQYNFLASNGCDKVQGYYFSKPLEVQEASNFNIVAL